MSGKGTIGFVIVRDDTYAEEQKGKKSKPYSPHVRTVQYIAVHSQGAPY